MARAVFLDLIKWQDFLKVFLKFKRIQINCLQILARKWSRKLSSSPYYMEISSANASNTIMTVLSVRQMGIVENIFNGEETCVSTLANSSRFTI